MNAERFCMLARTLGMAGSRRHLLASLTALPLVGSLVALLDSETNAAGRRKRRRKRHQHRGGDGKENRKGKRKGDEKGQGKCTKAGQAPKKGTPCCDGLVKDGGLCAVPASPPAPVCAGAADRTPCAGGVCCRGACQACCTRADCPANHFCLDNGTCQVCDVCPPVGACAFTTVQDAITFNSPPRQTILICPGDYTGDISIDRDLTLIGAGQGTDSGVDTILQGTGATTVMIITNNNQDVTLRDLRVTGGSSGSGGGINHAGRRLTMTACTVSGNAVSGNTFSSFGGGVFNATGSTADLTDCTISDNECTGDAGGAGVANFGEMTLTDCLVSGNSTTGDSSNGGGGLINFASGDLTLNRTVVRQNHANEGGGIRNSIGTMHATNCTITGNTTGPATVAGRGAGIYSFGDGTLLDACSVTENTAPDSTIPGVFFSEGGGLYNGAGTVNLANGTSIANNYAQISPNCGGGGITLGEGCAP